MLFDAALRRFRRQQYVHAEYRQLWRSTSHIDFTAGTVLCTARVSSACHIRKNRHLSGAAAFRCFIVRVSRCGDV